MKQNAEMSLFVKQVINNSLFFSDATVDIAMPILCTASSHAISVKAFRWRIWEKNTRLDHVTRNALAARNNEAYGQGNGRESFFTVLRQPLTHRHSLSDYFWGKGAAVHRVSETDNPYSNFVKIDG